MAAIIAGGDRAAALKEFDDTKAGVKGLVDSGITTVPFIFHHPNLHLSRPPSPALSIPTIDLSLPDPIIIMDHICSASRNYGFFQLINHGIPLFAIDATISAFRSFHELPADVKARYYTRDPTSDVRYNSNVDLYHSTAACWRDTLRVLVGSGKLDVDPIPEVCRKELLAWDELVKKVAAKVMAVMCEGLRVAPTRLEELKGLETRGIVSHYYPSCPEPDRTLGIAAHTDGFLLTVLIQDQIGGLQVKMKDANDGEEYWVDVKPITGDLLVNIGDLLQILSNDEYKSAEHRVLANSHKEARVSVATFFGHGLNNESNLLGPLPELISPKNPLKYKNFSMEEYVGLFYKKALSKQSFADYFKLSTNKD